MATLTNKTIASTYTSLLKLEGDTGSTVASPGAAVQVKTGDNDASPLYLNTDRIGIGTSSPDGTVHIQTTDGSGYDASAEADELVIENNGNAGLTITGPNANSQNIYFGSASTDVHAKIETGFDADLMTIGTTNANADLRFIVGNGSEAVRILDSGNVGIGLSAPTAPLHVKGANDSYVQLWNNHSDVNIGGMYNNTGHGVLQVKNSSAATKINLNSDSDSYFTGGNVLVGYTTATTNGGDTPQLQTHKTNNSNGLGVFQWGNNAAHSAMIKLAHSKSGTIGSHTILADNDSIGTIQFTGSDGTNFDTLAGSIHVEVDGTPAANRIPGAMTFSTSAVSDDGNAERMRITSSGQVLIGGTTDTAFTPSFSVQGTQPSISAYKDADAFVNIVVEEDHVDIVYDHAKDLRIGHATNVGGTSRTSNMIFDANSRISLSNNDLGTSNTIFGKNAGNNAVSGSIQNVFIGELSAGSGTRHADADGNTAVGYNSLTNLTQGAYNTMLGRETGVAITEGDSNIAIGSGAIATATTASSMVAIGGGALYSASAGQTTTDGTVAIGMNSLGTMTNGAGNVAVGYNSGLYTTTGGSNTYVGYEAGKGVDGTPQTSGNNVAIGQGAGTLLQGSAISNTFVGTASGNSVTTGTKNVIIGTLADTNTATGTNQTVIGYNAVGQGDNVVVLGDANVTHVCLGHEGATAVAKAAGFVSNSNYSVEGYSTGRNVIRSIRLNISPGDTPNTNISVDHDTTAGRSFNTPSLTDGTNIANNASSGSFALNDGSTRINIDVNNAIGMLSDSVLVHDLNSSSTTAGEIYFSSTVIDSNDLSVALFKTGSQSLVDWRTVLDAGDSITILITYMASS